MATASLFQAAILGTVQGLTEFLPVSSTGHLILFQKVFGLSESTYGLSFDMFTNLGTQVALILVFWPDIMRQLKLIRIPSAAKPLKPEEHQPWWIAGITVIVGIAGLLLQHQIDSTFRNLWIVATMLVVFGFVFLYAEKVAQSQKEKVKLDGVRAYGMGLSQILAFVPGVSRSGASISAGLIGGLDRETAARFSFLLSIPVTTLAIAKQLLDAGKRFSETGLPNDVALFYLIGGLSAGIVGYYSLTFLLAYVRRFSLAAFAYYRFALAGIIVLYLLIK